MAPKPLDEGIDQPAQLATLSRQGSLRFAMRAFALACDMEDGTPVTPAILQKAVDVMIGRAGRRLLSRILSRRPKFTDRPAAERMAAPFLSLFGTRASSSSRPVVTRSMMGW